MKGKKTIVVIISSILLVLAVTLTSFTLHREGDKTIEGKDIRNDIRIVKFEEFASKRNFDFNFELAKSKGYSTSNEHVTSEYLDLQSKYNQVLSLFLEERLSIAQLNNRLDELGTTKVPKTSSSDINSEESYYRNFSQIASDYLFLRNNIKIERLEKSDVELLNTLDINNPADKEKLMDMISRTFIDVLKVDLPLSDKEKQRLPENYKISNNGGNDDVANRNALIFCLSTETNYIANDEGDRQRDIKKLKNIEQLAEEYSLIFSEELNSEVKIFVHVNESSFKTNNLE